MSGDTARTPSKPKLRTSCDQCGAAKVRCDRNQPECGRCVSHGWACVYGVSRKMGKPPRGKHRQSFKRASSGGIPAAPDGHSKMDSSSSEAWDVACMGLDASDSLLGDFTGSYIPTSPSLDFGEWALPNNFALTPESLGSYPSTEPSTAHPTAHQSPSDSSFMAMPPGDGHDCLREAHDILRNLSFDREELLHPHHPASRSNSTAGLGLGLGSGANQVPLDHVLRLNCEARERLAPLLACHCARSPHLALLYAAIISRVLMWYQEAAGYTHAQQTHALSAHSQSPSSWGQASLAERSASSSHSRSGSSSSSCDPRLAGATMSQSPAAIAFAPAKMAIGTFSVDDLGIQTALKMQILVGEMKHVKGLIDQFISLNLGGDDSNFDGVDKSLHSWLRGEHSRINSTMRLKLRELNT